MFVGKQFISVEVQRQACHHNSTLNLKIHRTDQHPHMSQLCLVLTAGCAPNAAKTNLPDLNCHCRLASAGIHVQNTSGRQIARHTDLIDSLASPAPPRTSRRPDNSETLPLTGTPYHLTHVCTAVTARSWTIKQRTCPVAYARSAHKQQPISFSSHYDRQVLANQDRSN